MDSGIGAGQIIGLILQIILIVWGWGILNRKKRGVGYYILLVCFPLIGLIVAYSLNDLSEEEPSNDITDYNQQ